MRAPLLIGTLAAAAVALAGCSNAPVAPPPPPAASTPVAGAKAEQGVRGQITAITATTWTVTTAKGKAFTVTVGPQTVYGSKAAPATAAQFPVGTMVRVTGPRNGATVTATRIALAKARPAPTPTPAPGAPPATPTPTPGAPPVAPAPATPPA